MTSFRYEAYKPSGEVVRGSIEADTRTSALAELARSRLSVFKMNEAAASKDSLLSRDVFVRSAPTPNQRAQFLRELASLVAARIPIDEALSAAASEDQSPAAGALAFRLRDRVMAGKSLADAMLEEGARLPLAYSALVRAGEESGALDEVLNELATAQEQENDLAGEVRSALIYPGLLGVVAALSLVFIVTVLLPALRPLIEETGGNVPQPARALMWLSELVSARPLLSSTIAASIGAAVFQGISSRALKPFRDRLSLTLPALGHLTQELQSARICRTLGLLLSNRVEPLRALEITQSVASNSEFRSALRRARDDIQNGAQLGPSFRDRGVFPDQMIRLVEAGERSGQTPDMLRRAADLLERRGRRTVERLVALLTPMLTLALGLLVGGLVLSVMTTLMSANDAAF